MTSKTDFSEDEWTRLKRAPFVAGMAISLADPGGPQVLALRQGLRDRREGTGYLP